MWTYFQQWSQIHNIEIINDLITDNSCLSVLPALMFSSFVHYSSIKELKNMKLSKHISYEWLIEFCVTVALGTVCKRIIMKSVNKICFWKSKIWMFFGKKTKWKMVLRMHYW